MFKLRAKPSPAPASALSVLDDRAHQRYTAEVLEPRVLMAADPAQTTLPEAPAVVQTASTQTSNNSSPLILSAGEINFTDIRINGQAFSDGDTRNEPITLIELGVSAPVDRQDANAGNVQINGTDVSASYGFSTGYDRVFIFLSEPFSTSGTATISIPANLFANSDEETTEGLAFDISLQANQPQIEALRLVSTVDGTLIDITSQEDVFEAGFISNALLEIVVDRELDSIDGSLFGLLDLLTMELEQGSVDTISFDPGTGKTIITYSLPSLSNEGRYRFIIASSAIRDLNGAPLNGQGGLGEALLPSGGSSIDADDFVWNFTTNSSEPTPSAPRFERPLSSGIAVSTLRGVVGPNDSTNEGTQITLDPGQSFTVALRPINPVLGSDAVLRLLVTDFAASQVGIGQSSPGSGVLMTDIGGSFFVNNGATPRTYDIQVEHHAGTTSTGFELVIAMNAGQGRGMAGDGLNTTENLMTTAQPLGLDGLGRATYLASMVNRFNRYSEGNLPPGANQEDVVYDPVSNSFFQLVDGNFTQQAGRQLAEQRFFGGPTARLAHILDARTNRLLTEAFGDRLADRWLGGAQVEFSNEPDGGFQWSNGSSVDYANWESGEPNDGGGSEHAIAFGSARNLDGMQWNDLNEDALAGLLLEYPLNNGQGLLEHRYTVSLTAGQVASFAAQFAGVSNDLQGFLRLQLYSPTGVLLAGSVDALDPVGPLIRDFLPDVSGTYQVVVQASQDKQYQLSAAIGVSFDAIRPERESNGAPNVVGAVDISATRAVVGAVAPSAFFSNGTFGQIITEWTDQADNFTFYSAGNEAVTIDLRMVGEEADSPGTGDKLRVTLIRPNSVITVLSDNPGTPSEEFATSDSSYSTTLGPAGLYRLRVDYTGETEAVPSENNFRVTPYSLRVSGTPTTDPSTPATGPSLLAVRPNATNDAQFGFVEFVFDRPIRLDSFAASDIVVRDTNGDVVNVPLQFIGSSDGRAVYAYLDLPDNDAVYSLHLAAGAVVDYQDRPSLAGFGSYRLDRVPPIVVSSVLPSAPGFTSISFTFNELLRADQFLDRQWLRLTDPSGSDVSSAITGVNLAGTTLTFSVNGALTQSGRYSYSLTPFMFDEAGNFLDGDNDGEGGEFSEDAITGSFDIGQSDLVVQDINAPASVLLNTNFSLSYTVANNGLTASPVANNVRDRIFVSANPTLDPTDTVLFDTFRSGGIPPGGTVTYSTSFASIGTNRNLPVGNYYLIVQLDVDNVINETNDANNTAARAFALGSPPDLAVSNLVATGPASAGNALPVSFTLTNLGTVATTGQENLTAGVYLKNTTDPSSGDGIFVGALPAASALAPNGSRMISGSVAVPADAALVPGNYELTVRLLVPLAVNDPNPANNVQRIPIVVAAPLVPDLRVTSITLPPAAVSGSEIIVSWVTANLGTADLTNRSFSERLELLDADGNVRFAQDYAFTGSIAVNGSVQRSQTITLPVSQSGPLTARVTTDRNAQVFEFSNETNNITLDDAVINVTQQPFPQLRVTAITPAAVAFSGQNITVSWTVTNVGSATASGQWRDALYLSPDPQWNREDLFNLANTEPGVLNPRALAPGESYTSSITTRLPNGAEGTWTLFVVADHFNQLYEGPSNMGLIPAENISAPQAQPITLSPPPDLQVTSVVPSLSSAFSGQPFQLSYTVENRGLGATNANAWNDSIYISANPVFDGSAQFLTAVSHSGALANLTTPPTQGAITGYTATASVNLPIGIQGPHYFFVLTDSSNAVYEHTTGFENNNVSSGAPIDVLLTPPPDLAVVDFTAPASPVAGARFNLQYTVRNIGATTTPNSAWFDEVYLSTDNVLDGNDRLVFAGASYGPLTAQANGGNFQVVNTRNIVLEEPTEAGEYFLIARTDVSGNVFEGFAALGTDPKANNIASIPITVVNRTADLAISNLVIPASTTSGAAVSVQYTVANQGQGYHANGHFDRVFLSTSGALDASAVLVATVFRQPLAAGQSANYGASFQVPSGIVGPTTVIVVTDATDSLYEGADLGTNSISAPLTVVAANADLAVGAVQVSLSSAIGRRIDFDYVVTNVSPTRTLGSGWEDVAYLSTDGVLDPNDLVLGLVSTYANLPSSASYSRFASFSVPVEGRTLGGALVSVLPGTYQVLVRSDNRNTETESDEGNNVGASAPFTLTSDGRPDLTISALSIPTTLIAGASTTISATLTNLGAGSNESSISTTFLLSRDLTFDRFTDIFLGATLAPALSVGPNQSIAQNLVVTIPPDLVGPYFLIAITDANSSNSEPNEANNTTIFSQVVSIAPQQPADFVIGTITVPASGSAGRSATVSYTVNNLGATLPPGFSWTDALYLSADTTLQASDPLFARTGLNSLVIGSAGYSRTVTANLPTVTPGTYHVILRSDIFNTVREINETNNTTASATQISVNAPQLVLDGPAVADTLSGPSTPLLYQVSVTNANDVVRITLDGPPNSANTMFVRFGSAPTETEFDHRSASGLISDLSVTIPDTQAGTYYVLVTQQISATPGVTLRAQTVPFEITQVSATTIDNSGISTLRLDGARFNSTMQLALVNAAGHRIEATRLVVDSPIEAYVSFDAFNEPLGVYTLVATLPNDPADPADDAVTSVANAVSVNAGTGASTWVQVQGPKNVFVGQPTAFQVSYFNDGTADAVAPLIIIESPSGTPFGPTPGDAFTGPVFMVGASFDGAAEVLRPGARYGFNMHYRTPDAGGSLLDFKVGRIETTDARLITDWGQIERSIRPTDVALSTWQAWWGRVQPRIGNSWGDFAELASRLMLEVNTAGQAPVRDLRQVFSLMVQQQPNFVPNVSMSGTLLDSASETAISGVQIAAYREVSAGNFELESLTTTGADGSYVFSALRSGSYRLLMDQADWDMNRDQLVDRSPPVLLVTANDLTQQTLWAQRPIGATSAENDHSARVVLDADGVNHLFWVRNSQIWHAWQNTSGQWQDGQAVTGIIQGSFDVLALSNPAPNTAELILAWADGASNAAEIYFAGGSFMANGRFSWASAVQLTSNSIVDEAPRLVELANGETMVTFSRRDDDVRDDRDLYFEILPILALQEVQTEVVHELEPQGTTVLTFGRKIELTVKAAASPLGYEIKNEYGLAGALTLDDTKCTVTLAASATAATKFSVGFDSVSLSGGVSAAATWGVNKTARAWQLNKAEVSLTAGLSYTGNYATLRILGLFPPFAAPTQAIARFLAELQFYGLDVKDSITIGGTLGGTLGWTTDNGTFPALRFPDYGKLTFKGVIQPGFSIGYKWGGNITPSANASDPFSLEGAKISGQSSAGVSGAILAGTQYDLLPVPFANLSAQITGEVTVTYGQYSFKTGFPPVFVGSDEGAQIEAQDAPALEFLYTPGLFAGTLATYGANKVVEANDTLTESALSLATDSAGTFGGYARAINDQQARSEVFALTHGANGFAAPVALAGTGGDNSEVTAFAAANGQRFLTWIHADNSQLNATSSITDVTSVPSTRETFFSIWNGSAWSAAARIASTTGVDSDLSLTAGPNGETLAVWVNSSALGQERILTATWDGSAWSAPTVIATGERLSAPQLIVQGSSVSAIFTRETKVTNEATGRLYTATRNADGTWALDAQLGIQVLTQVEPQSSEVPLETLAGINPFAVPDKCLECDEKDKRQSLSQAAGAPKTPECSEEGIAQRTVNYCPNPVRPRDPNDILGPEGFGPEQWITADEVMDYKIRFENAEDATAPAQDIVITQTLDPDLDPRTFRLTSFGFGSTFITLDQPSAFYVQRIDLSATQGIFVDVTVNVNVATGELSMRLRAIDPATGIRPQDATVGVLPPNLNKDGRGEGFFAYQVQARADVPTGTVIDALASIVFDTEAPIVTPPIFNTLDDGKPVSAVAALPALGAAGQTSFTVSWAGADTELLNSGIAVFTIFVRENGGQWTEWLLNTTDQSAVYFGEEGRLYEFYSLAFDNAGNREVQATELVNGVPTPVADARIQLQGALPSIAGFKFLDANANGQREQGEVGLGGWTIFIDADNDNTLDQGELNTVTATDGSYTFVDLAPGTYRINEVLQPGWTRTLPSGGGYQYTVGIGDAISDASFGNYQLASISGVVFNDQNSDGAQGAGELGVGPVTLRLDRNADGSVEATITSDANGVFSFSNLEFGTYRITQVLAAGTADTTPTGARLVTINASGQSITGVTLGRVSGAELSGVKFEDLNGNGQREVGENGLAGWRIFIDANGNSAFDTGERFEITDASGAYTFRGLAAGSYTIGEVMQTGWMQTFPFTSPSAAAGPAGVQTSGSSAQLELPNASLEMANANATDYAASASALQLMGMSALRADQRFVHLTGSGVGVVVIDTGIDLDNPAFGADTNRDGIADRVVYQYDFGDNDAQAADRNGHGSHIASLIGSQDSRVAGVASDADLIILKVFGDDGSGSFGDLERALQWVLANGQQYNIGVINLSLGDGGNWANAVARYGVGDELAALAERNILITAAAGNNFYRTGGVLGVAYPGSDPAVLSVGATWAGDLGGPWRFGSGAIDTTSGADRITSFSQRHPELLDVFAPGARLVGYGADGSVRAMQGTSQASAQMAGVATLAQQLAQEHLGRRLSLAEFVALIDAHSTTVIDGDDEDDNVRNSGLQYQRVDVYRMAQAIVALQPGDVVPGSQTGSGSTGNSPTALAAAAAMQSRTIVAGQTIAGVDFGNFRLGVVQGSVFHDFNANGTRQSPAETGLQSWTVFLDANANDQLDTGERNTTTNAQGSYSFTDLTPGTYRVRFAADVNFVPTTLAAAPVVITSGATRVVDWGVNRKPTAGSIAAVSVNEGSTATATANASDAGDVLVYSLVGAPSNAAITAYTGELTWSAPDGNAVVPITVRATDQAGSFIDAIWTVTVNNVAPKLQAGLSNSTITAGQSVTVNFSRTADPGQDTISAWSVNWGDGSPAQVLAGTATSATRAFASQGSFTIVVSATDEDGTYAAAPLTLAVQAPQVTRLQVASFVGNDSGFAVRFNLPINPARINLYDGQASDPTAAAFGASDVVVTGSGLGSGVTQRRGNLVLDSDRQGFRYVITGGTLAAGTYGVTLVSGSDAFTNTAAGALDGDSNGTAGDNYTTSFTVAGQGPVLSVGDMVRGPGQAITAPSSAAMLPITLTNAAGASSLQFTLNWNPALLSVTGLLPGNVPGGAAAISTTLLGAGQMRVTVTPSTAFGATPVTIGSVLATVPATAPYGSKHTLSLTNVSLQSGSIAMPFRTDVGIHIVAYIGDASGDGAYTTLDPLRIQRVIAGTDRGFYAYPTVDPVLIGDVAPGGVLTATDTALLNLVVSGRSVPQVPAIPTGIGPLVFAGPDPTLSMPTVQASVGSTVVVPISIDTVAGLQSAQLTVNFAPGLTLTEVRRGSVTQDFTSFITSRPSANSVVIDTSRMAPLISGTGTLVELVFVVNPGASGTLSVDLTRARLNDSWLTLSPLPIPGLDGTDGAVVVVPAQSPRRYAATVNLDSAISSFATGKFGQVVDELLARGKEKVSTWSIRL